MKRKNYQMTPEMDGRFHNQPESGALSLSEHESVEAGRVALSALHKTFDLWVVIARAIKTLRDKADRLGGRWDFQRLMKQNGFAMDGTPHEKMFDKAIVSKLLNILDRLPEVTAWYEKLTPKQKRDWSAPTTIYKHCPVFAKPKPEGEPKLSKAEQTKQELAKALNKIHELEQPDDNRFNPNDTADNVADVIVGMYSPTKAQDIFRRGLAKLKARKAKAKDVA